ncbi:MAG: hypothetical protein F6J95_006955 [Leptolyngbya sp. SIO1E4]|nr:hypothetical protein [Leptolyngbya sp. SIO1E4]
MQRLSLRKQLPLDRVAKSLMAGLVAAGFALVALGDHATARVQEFSWQAHTVGAENTAFVITFSRPMDPQSVEANLTVVPELPGRISWAGRRMAYTLDIPIPYGETFELALPEARDRFSTESQEAPFEAFTGTFQSRDRAMAYIGTQGEETGRLVWVNFSQGGDPVILTPPELTVLDFETYPLSDRLLFSAVETAATTGTLTPALYTVTTGVTPNPPKDLQGVSQPFSIAPGEAGALTPVLDNETYQNLAFDLSPDGRVIVVQRVNQSDPEDFGPWVLREGEDPHPLETEPGGEFLIGPDSQTLLMLQGQGTAVIPLEMETDAERTSSEPLDFLPEFGRVFDISRDGSEAAMVDFNQNDPERRFTETLVVVSNQGDEQELLTVTGAILNAQFDPTARIVYVLASELLPGEAYQEQPFLAAINLETQEPLRLLSLPPQARAAMSLSPDGLAALLEVTVPSADNPNVFSVQTVLLPLFTTTEERLTGTPTQTEPQVLPYSGLLPTWLP